MVFVAAEDIDFGNYTNRNRQTKLKPSKDNWALFNLVQWQWLAFMNINFLIATRWVPFRIFWAFLLRLIASYSAFILFSCLSFHRFVYGNGAWSLCRLCSLSKNSAHASVGLRFRDLLNNYTYFCLMK